MVKQYPHYLFAILGGESVQDEDGNWSDSEKRIEMLSICREETDGRGSEIQIAGGTFHRFTSLVQLPKGSQKIEVGTSIFIADNANGWVVRVQGVVLKFDDGQLHSRLWV
jgi:hypothetical protein